MDRALTEAKIRHKFIRYTDRGHLGFTGETTKAAQAFIAELESHEK